MTVNHFIHIDYGEYVYLKIGYSSESKGFG